jgi:four helix bundle protein
MSRDFRKLNVFKLADELTVNVYRATRGFPPEERYGLQAQLRRASVSVPCNIVEGSTRGSDKDYANFLRIACGSASEVRYLLSIARRLGLLRAGDAEQLEQRYDGLVRGLEVFVQRVAGSRKQGN